MKNIIIYTTKYGCTEKASNILKSKMGGETLLVNAMKEKVPSLDEYDNVILGGSIYIGKIQKELTSYITGNLPSLLKKRIGLFICAGAPDENARIKELETVFPKELYTHAVCKELLGFEMCFEKLKFLDRTMSRMLKGNTENSYELSEEKIESFAKAMSSSK